MRLIHGDCLDKLLTIEPGSINMVLCDPPYGTTAAKWDVVLPFNDLWPLLFRVCREDAAIVLHSTQPFTTSLIASARNVFRYAWVWDKGVGVNFLHAKRQPLKVTEDICVFYRKQPTYNPQMTPREKPIKKSNNNVGETSGYTVDPNKYVGRVYDQAYPSNLLRFSSRSKGSRGLHPTQKPVELLKYLIRTYTNVGESVLDFCMGSGSTGVAAMECRRKFYGIEKDKNYFSIACDRIRAESASTSASLK